MYTPEMDRGNMRLWFHEISNPTQRLLTSPLTASNEKKVCSDPKADLVLAI
jgi:hypothetical protein